VKKNLALPGLSIYSLFDIAKSLILLCKQLTTQNIPKPSLPLLGNQAAHTANANGRM
jgi:hypothetical protein